GEQALGRLAEPVDRPQEIERGLFLRKVKGLFLANFVLQIGGHHRHLLSGRSNGQSIRLNEYRVNRQYLSYCSGRSPDRASFDRPKVTSRRAAASADAHCYSRSSGTAERGIS